MIDRFWLASMFVFKFPPNFKYSLLHNSWTFEWTNEQAASISLPNNSKQCDQSLPHAHRVDPAYNNNMWHTTTMYRYVQPGNSLVQLYLGLLYVVHEYSLITKQRSQWFVRFEKICRYLESHFQLNSVIFKTCLGINCNVWLSHCEFWMAGRSTINADSIFKGQVASISS